MNLKRILILGILIFISLSFLLFQEGFWLYVDSGGWPMTKDRVVFYLRNAFFSFSNYTAFGYDDAIISSTRLLQTLTKAMPMYLNYVIFFLGCFFSSYACLRILFPKKASFYGALIFTFNPISLYFLKQVGYLYGYFSLPLIISGAYYFIRFKYIHGFIGLLLGTILLFSYTRLTGIYGFFVILLSIFYSREIWKFLKENKTLSIIFFTFSITVLSPIILSFLYPYLNGDKLYFSGLGNYVDTFTTWGKSYYKIINADSFLNSFTIKEPLQDFGSRFQSGFIFQVISGIMLLSLLGYSATIKPNKEISRNLKKLLMFSLIVFMFCIFLRMCAKFLNLDYFMSVIYGFFPFLANNTRWIFILYIPLISFLVSYSIFTGNHSKYIIFGVYGYIFLSIFPLVNYKDNFKLQTLDLKKTPISYQENFYADGYEKNSSLLLPYEAVKLDWSPYPIKIYNNTLQQSILGNNIRSVNNKQGKLYSSIYKYNDNISNLAMLNLQDIFVFRDVENVVAGKYDYYNKTNIESKAAKIQEKIKTNKDLHIKYNSPELTKYGIKGEYDYFIYSPQKIVKKEISDFMNSRIDIYTPSLIIDENSFNKPTGIENVSLDDDIRIDYKIDKNNPTLYYLKISGISEKKSFIVHMNQTFGNSWKLKWIDESTFKKNKCTSDYIYSDINNNSNCEYNSGSSFGINYYSFLGKEQVSNENHFEGNFIGNTWLIENDNLREQDKNKNEVYAVIIYEKQFWYILTIFTAAGIMGLLILLALIQIFSNQKKGIELKK